MLPRSTQADSIAAFSIILNKPQWFPFPNDNSSQDLPQLFSEFHSLPVVAERKRPQTFDGEIKVGILHSLSGTMAISETTLKEVEEMAIKEINDAGGVTGRR